jgi:hypothetical protein
MGLRDTSQDYIADTRGKAVSNTGKGRLRRFGAAEFELPRLEPAGRINLRSDTGPLQKTPPKL